MKRLLYTGLIIASSSVAFPAAAELLHFEIPTQTVGKMRLVCHEPDSWSFKTSTEMLADGKEVVTVTLDSPTPAVPPEFSTWISVPHVDIHHLWQASDPGICAVPMIYGAFRNTHLAFGMPLYAFFNNSNGNRLTVATDEINRRVRGNFGIREEGCNAEGNLFFFIEKEAPSTHYETHILLDSRPVFWAEAVREGADWMAESAGIVPAEVPEAAFDPLYSSWYQFHQNVYADAIEAETAKAAAVGMKTLIVDDGWQTDDDTRGYKFCGDWEVSKNRFPDFKSHVEKVHANGMKYLMWYTVPYMGMRSKNYKRFEGKFLNILQGDSIGVLDPRFPEVRSFLCDLYETAMKERNLDGFKLDFIDCFTYSHDPALDDNYAGRDFKTVPEGINALMKDVYRRLHAAKPDVLIEFRQDYEGPAIRQFGNMIRVGDCPGDPHDNRMGIANLRLTSGNMAVHADMLEWNPANTAEDAALNVLCSMFGTIQYSMNLGDLPQPHMEMIRHWLGFSQKHRTTLLKSDFRPWHPEMGYPVIEAESPEECIMGIYKDMMCVPVANCTKPQYVINATGSGSVVLELAKKPKVAEAYDTFGNRVACAKPKAGLNRIEVPESGYLLLRW